MNLRLIPKSLDPFGAVNFMLLCLLAAGALMLLMIVIFAVGMVIEAAA